LCFDPPLRDGLPSSRLAKRRHGCLVCVIMFRLSAPYSAHLPIHLDIWIDPTGNRQPYVPSYGAGERLPVAVYLDPEESSVSPA
jgi:hypothetical protein